MRKLITLTCLTILLVSCPASANQTGGVSIHSLNNPKAHGEIQGLIKNCTSQNNLEDVLLHVPGKSIATRLADDGSFHLHWVPTGTYNLELEINDQRISEIKNIPVKEGSITHLQNVDVCVTEKEKQNIVADTSRTNKASKIRCPKGGFTCSSSWHNIKAKNDRDRETGSMAKNKKEHSVYKVSEGMKLIRIQ